ncbi:hypothetical protein ONS95_000733 [Cadophora gregata]|uniref:uncharacterized protein n=1 Tax=Cadophora gregata TaxID=51156 RepID=UPI0026DC900F|nr:uncharacterized protein ONS95_000733 [Cadophora gregata]KAK0103088.1 hypothetical protein ONS96_005699 [Cadophora gregata f. sp. sojae]KAK0128783.1 hypothetical protein ONS95_000733 [Cadophora gregata]
MQLPILAVFACLVTWVAADGLRNGYERVWLWYAYQIDLTLPEADRQIGKKCIKWDFTNKNCPPTYQPTGKKGKPVGGPQPNTALCSGTRPGGACYFWEFMGHIDGKRYQPRNMWLLPTTDPTDIEQQKNLKPDVATTAKWLSEQHGDPSKPLELSNNIPRATIYAPWRVYQGVGEIYNDMLRAVGAHSADTISKLSADQKAALKDELDAVKLSLRSTIVEREIDHSKHIFDAGTDKGFALAKRTEAGYTGDIVDWDETRKLHSEADFNKFYNDYYHLAYNAGPPPNDDAYKASKAAREHLQVMDDFRFVESGALACGI